MQFNVNVERAREGTTENNNNNNNGDNTLRGQQAVDAEVKVQAAATRSGSGRAALMLAGHWH